MARDPFAPPPEDEPPVQPVEIEKEWAEEKARKQATAVVADTPKPDRRSNTWLWVALGVIVAGVVAAGVVVQLHAKQPPARELPATEGTVSIEIRANPRAPIRIDGHKAGMSPVTLHVRKGTTPVQIDNGKQTKSVIPDRDQLVDFTR
jgi:hypothetical protein